MSTPFDIHATLMDILHLPSIEKLKKVQDSAYFRALSLFRPIPENRTCEQVNIIDTKIANKLNFQAGVEAHWCTCLDWQNALKEPEDIEISSKLADVVVYSINQQLKNVTHLCSPLQLDKLIYARKYGIIFVSFTKMIMFIKFQISSK